MIQEQKELLLKDLCARLPYGVIVETPKGKGRVCNINFTIFGVEIGVNINPTIRDTFSIDDVKPYLCPILSMTEEQQKDLSTAIEQLINDIEAGRKYMKVYKQMKMYNDPNLNPVLYGKK